MKTRVRKTLLISTGICLGLCAGSGVRGEGAAVPEDDEFPVQITHNVPYVDLAGIHNGETVRLARIQDTENMVDFDYALTSRPCPPFCIQPMKLGPGIETVGELEVIDYIRRIAADDDSIAVIDSRTANWLHRGMIPGAISIPWKKLHYGHTDQDTMMEILQFQLGVVRQDNFLNFQDAKTLVLYCNGNWCGQSVTSIRSLLMMGYPPHKLKWYRAGMNGWQMLGLTTVTPPGPAPEEAE